MDLHIAEIPFEDGVAIRLRYSRYLSEDGTRWIRHGLFLAYWPNGTLASDGTYEHGKEQGLWRDFHENGTLAAQGPYEQGIEAAGWHFWNPDGVPESKT